MATLASSISDLASQLGTVEGLNRATTEILALNDRLTDARIELSRDETLEIYSALKFLGKSISEMSRVARGMLASAGVRGVENVG